MTFDTKPDNGDPATGSSLPPRAPAQDPRDLRKAFGRFATGITVVTAATPDGPLGITANSFSSVSLEPAMVLWSIGRHSRRFDAFARADFQAIHVLGEDQADLCRRFSHTGIDFTGLEITYNRQRVPLLSGTLARFEVEIVDRIDAGDHVIQLGRVQRLSLADGEPLVFAAGRYGRLAGAPS
ncbi:MAG: flavin reductase family protein [Oricola sp.]